MPRYPGLPLLGLALAAARFGPALPVGVDAATPRLHAEVDPAAAAADDADDPPEALPHQSLIAMQFHDDPYEDRDKLRMILDGELGLAGIRFGPGSFSSRIAGGDDEYGADVHGEFCAYDPSLNRKDPDRYPTFDDIQSASDHCAERRYSLPLREVADAVRSSGKRGAKRGAARSLPVSGLVFHEGHAGAGLLSNALATFDSTLVVSDHPAVRDALGACDVLKNRYRTDDCVDAKRLQAAKDVVTLLARTSAGDSDKVRKFYLKVDGGAAAYLPEVRSLFPNAAWAFVYRNDADEALAKATEGRRTASCLKARRNPSAALAAKAAAVGKDLEGLTPSEVCALRLSTLLDAAAREHDKDGSGTLVSYDDDVVNNADAVSGVLVHLGLGKDVRRDPRGVRDRVKGVLARRSKTRARHDPEEKMWNGERVEVTDEVAAASHAYMRESMDRIVRSHGRA